VERFPHRKIPDSRRFMIMRNFSSSNYIWDQF
jgi:hypothetical protein